MYPTINSEPQIPQINYESIYLKLQILQDFLKASQPNSLHQIDIYCGLFRWRILHQAKLEKIDKHAEYRCEKMKVGDGMAFPISDVESQCNAF